MDFQSITLVLYNCPSIFERLVGYTCHLSDTEEMYVHAIIVGILFVLFGISLFILRGRRKSREYFEKKNN
jgi:hypothetical protein